MAYQFNIETFYDKTDNGLEILKHFLGNCKDFDKALQNQKNPFFYRSESTASATLIPNSKVIKSNLVNYWRLKDFGGNFHTPISIAMEETGLEFYPCLKYLYELFQLAGANNEFFKAETEASTLDDKDKRELGWFNIVLKPKCEKLDIIGKFVTEEIANKYHFYSVDYYEKVFYSKKTNLKTYIKVTATDSFPIFAYMPDKSWCKLYAPFSQDKQYKHGYLGNKPERYVHGLEQIKEAYNKEIAEFNKKIDAATKNKDNHLASKLEAEKLDFKLPCVIGSSGGTDGMNVDSLGYHTFWYNSESEQLNYEEYQELKKIVHILYNLPDVDTSGIKYGYEVAEKYWNLKSIWLPKEKLGAKGKDLRDWMKFYKSADLKAVKFQFSNLLTGALRMKFFDRNAKTKALKINTAYLHYFLKVKGFFLYYPDKIYLDRTSEQEFIFIRIENNIVYQEFANTIKKYCERYMIDKGQPVEVINLIKNTTQFTDKNLLGLDSIVLNIKNYTADSQKFYFKNQFATITADKIDLQGYTKLDTHIWNNKLINYTVFPEKPFFSYKADENGVMKLELLRNDCEYMNFLINTSRMHWKKEFEHFGIDEAALKAYKDENRFRLTSEYLSEEENTIHEQHFLSKMFANGYMLHRYKIDSFARLLYIMDNTEIDSEEERNGGTGKTLQLKGLDPLMQRFRIDGSQENLFKNPFILGSLNKEFDYILIDDYSRHYNIDPVYVWVTDGATINPKFKSSFDLKFEDFPKIAITRNFGLKRADGSDNRRIIYNSNSDFYHSKSKLYDKEHRVAFDFGHDLFKWSHDSKQPSIHFGFLMQCLQLYLQFRDNELLAPQKNIDLNNSLTGIGDTFKNWADAYFVEDFTDEENNETVKGTLNNHIRREDMMLSYVKSAGKMAKNATNFKKSLKEYCALILKDKDGKIIKDFWQFNPADVQGYNSKNKNIYKRVGNNADEHFFIRVVKPDNAQPGPTQNEPKPADDLPF